MIDFLLSHINNDVSYLYSLILQLILAIGSLATFVVFIKKFDVVPVFKYFIAYFWLMAGLFWINNLTQTMLQLNQVAEAKYLSYAGIFFFIVQSVIVGTYCLSAIFQYFRFSPIFFFISLIYHTVGLFLLFIQKDIFMLVSDEWISQFTIAGKFQPLVLLLLGGPFLLFLITMLIQNIYYWISQKYHPLHRLNLHIVFTLVIYLGFFTLFYYDFINGWYKVLFLLAMILAPLFAYLLLIKNPAYQEDIINPADDSNKLKVNLLLKMLGGEVISIAIPLTIANLLIYIYYSNFSLQLNGEAPMISHTIFQHAIIINLMILVLSVTFHSIMAKIMIYRIQDLIKGTQEVQRENFNYYIEAKGYDELSVLTRSFNKMVETLKNYKQELKNYSTILESEIEKQTLELRKKRHEAEILAEQNMTLYKQLQKQTNTIIDNITDSLIAVDDQNRIMTINKTFSEKFEIKDDYSGKDLTELEFIKQYEIDKIIQMFHDQKLKKYNFRLNLTKPYYGTMQCYLSVIDLDKEKRGALLLMQDTTPPWGTVLNAATYEPLNLAIVRLFDYDSNKLVETAVTDENGRFGFFVKPGRYYLTTDKENFHFPSKNRSGYHGEIIEVRTKEEGIIKVNILLDPLENVRLGIQTDAPAPTETPVNQLPATPVATTPVMPIPTATPTPEPPIAPTATEKTLNKPAASSLMGNIPDVPVGPNVQQESDNLMDNANLVGLGQNAPKAPIKAKEPIVINSDLITPIPPTTETPGAIAAKNNPAVTPITNTPVVSPVTAPTIPPSVTAAPVTPSAPVVPTVSTPAVPPSTPTTPIIPTSAASAAPSTALSDRARAAKEAKKAELGNKNIEEKPGAMLEKIEEMIEEEKKIKGVDDDINGAVTNVI